MDKAEVRQCLHCTKNFKTFNERKVYCNAKCKWRAWAKTHPRIAMPVADKQATREAETGTA